MPRACSVCTHEDLPRIDAELAAGASLRGIAGRFGTSKSAVERHRSEQHTAGSRLANARPALAIHTNDETAAGVSGHPNGTGSPPVTARVADRPSDAVVLRAPGPDSGDGGEQPLQDPASIRGALEAAVAGRAEGFPGFADAQRARPRRPVPTAAARWCCTSGATRTSGCQAGALTTAGDRSHPAVPLRPGLTRA